MDKEKEFTDLIKEYQGMIFKITTMYCADAHDQQDLYQEIVYQVWKSFDSFKKKSKRSTWMYCVAMNTAITHYKRSKKIPVSVPIEKVVLQQIESDDREFEQRLSQLYHHIQQLNMLDKGIMLLVLEGKKYDEIAEITGMSPSNVGTRISRIKKKLESKIRS